VSLLRAVPHPAVRGRFSRARIRSLVTPTRLDWVVGGVVLLVYAVVQLVLLLGPHPFDPARYFRTSFDFPDVNPNLWTLRIGLMAPVRLAVAVLGPSEAALYAVPLAVGLLLAAAVYATTLVLFGERLVAAAAALVTVLNANFLLNSSFIFPDTAATATFAAGFFFLVLGGTAAWSERLGGRAPAVAAVLAGLLFGWTYLIREFSPVLLPVVVAALVILHYPVRRAVLVAGAAVGVGALELLYGLLIFDRPFVHLDLLLDRGDRSARGTKGFRVDYIQDQVDDPLDAILVLPRLLLTWQTGWLVLALVAVFVAALVVLRRERRLWILGAWCFGFWAVMVLLPFLPTPSGRWLLNVTNIRYWYPLFPALAMGSFGGLLLLLRTFPPPPRFAFLVPTAAPLLAAVVLVPGLVEFDRCAGRDLWRNDPAERWDDLREWFATPEADRYRTVRTDQDSARLLPAYVRTTFGHPLWSGRIRTFSVRARNVAPSNPDGALLLLHRDRMQGLPNVEQRLRELAGDWAPVFVSEDERMVVLAYRPPASARVAPGLEWWRRELPPPEQTQGCGLSPYEPPAR
jgi:hypothetical protein